jgi:hypothetical protein
MLIVVCIYCCTVPFTVEMDTVVRELTSAVHMGY